MLDVADYERIRRRVRIEGKTQRQAADELGHSISVFYTRKECLLCRSNPVVITVFRLSEKV